MFKFFSRLFDDNRKTLDKYRVLVEQINTFEPSIKKLSDSKLAAQTKKFKKAIEEGRAAGKTDEAILDEVLPEVFATVRETSRRVLGLRHFDVQLLAGIALHKSNITEQKTGEGKTLTVTAPIYLNALLGKGVHLVTVNDYLAELGAGWMGQIYHFLGLSTAVIVHDKSSLFNPEYDSEVRGDERLEHFQPISRQQAYNADITYGTNNEFGFDYLRDNMVQSIEMMVQRPDSGHHYAIVDEADSILIDEARTPLIISMPDTEPTKKYYDYARMVLSLEKNSDYTMDEKARTVTLTDLGVKRIEQKLGVGNLYEESFETIHHVESALKSKTLFLRDRDYIVKDNQVIIVDEHTGRLMYGRRYSDGLHQAIEAKEGVPIQQESRTLATISIQNYFRLYHKLSGMTGTAVTEAEEFKQIYNTEVLAIPTHVQVARQDSADVIYKTTAVKYSAIANEAERIHQTGQPILIGTRSIEHNEIISDFLKRKRIPHQVLNAKNHEREAFIIADAGKKAAITVATNIAGRGVDIVLGGSKPELKDFRTETTAKDKKPTAKQEELAKELQLPPSINPANYKLAEYKKALAVWQENHDEVIELGGLYIIGTERHESRRIDNQLRGRSGRQGDPGVTQFFIALDDDIMRIFGGEQIAKVMDFLKIEENQPIEHGMIGKSIEAAQVKVEGFFFDQRKRLVEFDDVMNKQREIIYKRRRRLLEQGTSRAAEEPTALKEEIMTYIKDDIASVVSLYAPQDFTEAEYATIIKEFATIIPFDAASQKELVKTIKEQHNVADITEKLYQIATETYASKEQTLGSQHMRLLERLVSLSVLDQKWMDHLDAMEDLREGIWLRGDKRTVLSEYKKEAFILFEDLIGTIESTIAKRVYRDQLQGPSMQTPIMPDKMIEQKEDVHESLEKEVADASVPDAALQTQQGSLSDMAAVLQKAKATQRPQPGESKVKINRNDPCPCGSGLKYKKCGLINAPQHRG
jgi:preprotein translocase subunit SecA